ncbi:1,2-phenylacetyl-CoA epoxidase subunit A, partial [Kitasatospora sp. A2-31]|nr:1,2-phenylacetyl-CoA epoxidase subunit A [Kitasatospora sp. A2-31]
ELTRVIHGQGPCNAQRIERRRAAHEDGAWVREAASAYAAKRRAEAGTRTADEAQHTPEQENGK